MLFKKGNERNLQIFAIKIDINAIIAERIQIISNDGMSHRENELLTITNICFKGSDRVGHQGRHILAVELVISKVDLLPFDDNRPKLKLQYL